jgi:hypothetical protein
MMKHTLEYPDGTTEVINYDTPLPERFTHCVRSANQQHTWDQISGGVHCTSCDLRWYME